MALSLRARILAFLLLLPWGVASLSGIPVEPDARKVDPFLVRGQSQAVPRTAVPSAPGREGSSLVPVFVKTHSGDSSFEDRVRGLGGGVRRISDRLYVAHVPPDSLRYLTRWDSVRYVEGGKRTRPMLDVSRSDISADDVHAGAAGLPRGFTGAGVNVGIVDTGLDDSHSDFRDSLDATRVIHTYSAPFPSPGTSADPLTDEDGHGTHVTGIASGNGMSSGGTYTGMAPESNLLVGKTNFFTTDIVVAIADLMNRSAGPPVTPIAVNLSAGLMTGPHDGTDEDLNPLGSLFSQAINDLATNPPGGKGVIVVAAGNERNGEEHFRQATLPPFGAVVAFLKNLRVPPGRSGIDIDIWADGEDRYTVTVTMGSSILSVPSGTSVNVLNTLGIFISNRADAPPNGATHVAVVLAPRAGTTSASIRFDRIRNGGTGRIDAYLDNFFDPITGFVHNTFQGSTESGTVTEPANADNVIAVGSYNTKSGVFSTGPLGAISTFSSLGPTRDGRTKPDLAAPGSFLWSTRSFDAPSENYFDLVPGNDNYAILAGTSMSAPHVTGIAALVWESNPALTGAQMRERLKKTADPRPGAPDNTWGQGIVNAFRAVSESVASITAPATALPGSPVSLTSENSSGALGMPLTGYAWSLVPPAGSGSSLSGATSPSASFTPDLPGEYRVDLTVTQGDPAGTPGGSATVFIHANHLPTASIAGSGSGTVESPASFSGAGSSDDDNQGLALHWVLVSRPAGSQSILTPVGGDNAVLTPNIPGNYEVGLRADDGLDNSALAIKTFTALSGPQAPVFVSTPVLTATAGIPYSYDANATGNPVPTYDLSVGPPGMEFDNVTGLITWTPTTSQEGAHGVEIRASNGTPPDAVQSFQIDVVPPASGGGGGGGCSLLPLGSREWTRGTPTLPALIVLSLVVLRIRTATGKRTGKRKR